MGCATSKDAASDAPPECTTRPYRRERLGPKAPTLATTTPAHCDTDSSSDVSPDPLNEREKARAVRRARIAHQLAEQQRIEQLRRARYLESFDALDNLAVSRLHVRQRSRPSVGASASPIATLHDGTSFDATSGDLPGAVSEEDRALSMSQQLLSSAPSLQHPLSSAPSVYDLLRSQSSDGEGDDEGADAIRHVAVTEEDDGAEDLQSEAGTATCYDVEAAGCLVFRLHAPKPPFPGGSRVAALRTTGAVTRRRQRSASTGAATAAP
eukprot:CAMPEP_0174855162 /NCGR_PEP_ID=MMETSP1114-20130205/32591_1 /TAXON_ID=312471 /ORGANISM="Neobodo designis, Strain CCAP 1951/1" /LENGTH=266 /DNA_ID=CAMNT_0016089887 /DNA_START=48 /DNA_END=849 /DNA_ORIENTATION=+